MAGLLQDVRYALRQLRKNPGFTTVAVVTLALGIGANTAIFSVIEAVLLRPLPYRNTDRLMVITDAHDSDLSGETGGILYGDFSALNTQARSFEDLALYYRNSGWSRVMLNAGAEPQFAQGAFVSASLFPMLGVRPVLGRWFTPEEETRREPVVLLSHRLWVQQFGASREIVGKTLRINGVIYSIIGVMPEDFQFPARDAQFWAPITTSRFWGDPAIATVDPQRPRGFYARWKALAKLKPGATPGQAQAEVKAISMQAEPAGSIPDEAVPLHVSVSGKTRLVLLVLASAVLFVLLIACINVANLMLARSAVRQCEFAIRAALGAKRSRLVRQLFAEALLLLALAACLGTGLSLAGIRVLIAFGPRDISRLEQSGIDARVLAFTVVLSVLSALGVSILPVWKDFRNMHAEGLQLETRSASASASLKRTHGVLVVAEFAIAVVLLAGAGLLIHSFLAVQAVEPGFEPSHLLTMDVSPPLGASEAQQRAFYRSALERVSALPGVQAAGAVDGLFEFGTPTPLNLRAIEGRALDAKDESTRLIWDTVSGNYFRAMGIPLLYGRYFSQQDGPGSPLVAIIDQNMARRYWADENPVGQRIKGQDRRGANDDWVTIIGVSGNIRNHGVENRSTPHVYEWAEQSGRSTPDLVVRTAVSADSFAAMLRAAVRDVNRGAVISSVSTMEEQLSNQLSPRRFQVWLMGLFSLVALFLASLGIYGTISYSVTRRVPEIGIRMALGAARRDVVKLVVSDGAKFAVAGLALGVIAALGLTRFMASLLFGVRTTDALTFLSVGLVLLGSALLACYIPARRAAKVDPMEALRYE
jgi:predicted permease